jgi:pimeloyl-ACP methyl ester carboxylesterase
MVDRERRIPERVIRGERPRVHFARETTEERQLIHLPDGRKLAIKSFGNPTDPTVAGNPGSRFGPVPFEEDLRAMGVRLITFDRPGYGDSDPNPSYTTSDVADDIRYALDELGIEKCSVAGRSGGGRYALEFASLYPDVVEKIAILAGDIPPHADIDRSGMDESNQILFGDTELTEEKIHEVTVETQRLYRLAMQQRDTLTIYPPHLNEIDHADIALVDGLEEAFLASFQEAWSKGYEAILQDALTTRKNWGENLQTLRTPVRIYHGTEDHYVPYKYGKWLADTIPNAEMVTLEGHSHFVTFSVFPEALSWLVKPALRS